jgi:chemotaxis response regulator CheB
MRTHNDSSDTDAMRRFDTFLIVEDDPNIRVLLEELFHFEGFAVVTMENGQDAILWLRGHQPALVILDLPLPLVPGEGVLAELLTLYNGAVPCITMTAGSRPVGPSAHGELGRISPSHLRWTICATPCTHISQFRMSTMSRHPANAISSACSELRCSRGKSPNYN